MKLGECVGANAIQAKRDLDNFDSLNSIGRMRRGECDSGKNVIWIIAIR